MNDYENRTTAKQESDLLIAKFCYQLIKTMKKLRKKLDIGCSFSVKETVHSAKCETTTRAHDAFCPFYTDMTCFMSL